jgi:hypothetical protein
MKSPRFWLMLCAVAALAGAGWWTGLRRERAALELELAALGAAADAARATPPPVTAPPPLSPAERAELLALRGQAARLLRARLEGAARGDQAAKAGEAGAAGASSLHRRLGLPPDYRLVTQFEFRGFQTPAAALESYFAAVRAQDTNLVLAALTGEVAGNLAKEFQERGAAVFEQGLPVPPGFRILAEEQESDDTVRMQVEALPGVAAEGVTAVRGPDGTWRLDLGR